MEVWLFVKKCSYCKEEVMEGHRDFVWEWGKDVGKVKQKDEIA
jgi:hypothetical protein